MNLDQISSWRSPAGKAGACLCLIAMLALVDGLLVLREPTNFIKVLPGAVTEIDGVLTDKASNINELTYVSSSDQLRVTFSEIHKGYYLGREMWRGRLLVGPHLAPGEYSLAVVPRHSASPRKVPAFRILVFADAHSLQQSSSSLVRRFFGISPFAVAAVCLPGILLAFGAVYWLSGKRDLLLAAGGKAEIYQVIRGDGGYEIRFGLGTNQGIKSGTLVCIYNKEGLPMGTATVEVSNETDSAARVTVDREIKPGFLVSRTSTDQVQESLGAIT